jgi:aspartate aminotransferase
MSSISTRASSLTPSLTLSIDSKAKAMKAEGLDVCGFAAGEPDFDTPEHIKAAAIDALNKGLTKYTPSSGIPELRQAIAEKFAADNKIEYKASQVIVSNGAKQSCFNAILATCEPGDEVVIPSPYWLSYPEMVRIAGADPVFVQTKEQNGWKMTAEEFENAMTPRTKMVILNTPGNPTGAVYTREELEKIVEVAATEDILILSDEIYEKLVYDGTEHISVASLSDEAYKLTITVTALPIPAPSHSTAVSPRFVAISSPSSTCATSLRSAAMSCAAASRPSPRSAPSSHLAPSTFSRTSRASH